MNKIRLASSPKEVLAVVAAHAGDFDDIHTSTCLYEIAKRRRMLTKTEADSPMLRDLVDFLDYQVVQMTPYSLANTAWSVAQLEPHMGKHVLKLMPTIAEHSILTISKFTPRYLSNLAWACATVKYQNRQLFEAIADAIRPQMKGCNAQDLSNLVWAFAALGFKDEVLVDTIACRAESIIDSFPAQSLANLAWGLAALGIEKKSLMDAIEGRALSTIHTFTGQNLGNLAWSYWRWGLHKPKLMAGICDALCKLSIARGGKSMIKDWTVVMPAAVSMGVVDKATLSLCAGALMRPGVLRAANDYSIAALTRSAQLDGWERKEPELFQGLQTECEVRQIRQAALESKLLVDPSKWFAAFR